MIKVIYGKKGSGKTKRIIDMANQSVKDHLGDLVFIDDDNRYMFDLRHEVRFVNAKDFKVNSPDMFLGFLSGIVASNYDMSLLFVDGFLRIVQANVGDLEPFFSRLETIAEQHQLTVVISIGSDPDTMPAFFKKYLVDTAAS